MSALVQELNGFAARSQPLWESHNPGHLYVMCKVLRAACLKLHMSEGHVTSSHGSSPEVKCLCIHTPASLMDVSPEVECLCIAYCSFELAGV